MKKLKLSELGESLRRSLGCVKVHEIVEKEGMYYVSIAKANLTGTVSGSFIRELASIPGLVYVNTNVTGEPYNIELAISKL